MTRKEPQRHVTATPVLDAATKARVAEVKAAHATKPPFGPFGVDPENYKGTSGFRSLTRALSARAKLGAPPEDDCLSGVVAADFRLMTVEYASRGGTYVFKHHTTRNYLWLHNGRLGLGDGVSVFQKNEYR